MVNIPCNVLTIAGCALIEKRYIALSEKPPCRFFRTYLMETDIMTNEYELKFLNIDKEKTRMLFLALGYELSKPEFLMKRQTYHLPKTHPDSKGRWGRVRDEGDKITATIKWYDNPDNPSISSVHEKEVVVNTWEDGAAWVQAQGFESTAYQENTRETWTKPNVEGLEITIDTWPGLNPYVEIEAPSENAVKFFAEELGYDFSQGLAGGSEIIYQLELGIDKNIIKSLPEITFANPPRRDVNEPP
jgi:adenylate cyclase class 2